MRALEFFYLPPTSKTHVGKIKTKELGIFREDTFIRYKVY
jgi:hypothetical protein